MTEKLTKDQKAEVIAALDEALEKAPWDATKFLSLLADKLRSIRDDVANNMDVDDGHVGIKSSPTPNRFVTADRFGRMKKLYVALYAFDGSNLQSWERILQHLPNQVISRPVYENEEDVIASIRSKRNRFNEAYVSVYVEPQFILPQPVEKIVVDKLGVQLVGLKSKAIQLENIDVFIHQTGTYTFANGRLIKQN